MLQQDSNVDRVMAYRNEPFGRTAFVKAVEEGQRGIQLTTT